MSKTEKAMMLLGVWLGVYPSVLLLSYVFEWLEITWPLWVRLLCSTAVTVPLISFVAVPTVQKLIAARKGDTEAELKLQQAREADGPDPEDLD